MSGQHITEFKELNGDNVWAVTAFCSICTHPVGAMVAGSTNSPRTFKNGLLVDVIKIFPPPPVAPVPDFLPDHIAAVFVESYEALGTKSWRAAGGMARCAVDLAIKKMDPEAPRVLKQAIDRLHANGTIPKSLADWADQVRGIGNEALHSPEGVEEDEAREAFAFAEMFLTYAFTLPARVEERRLKRG